jgi:hypothetical protein
MKPIKNILIGLTLLFVACSEELKVTPLDYSKVFSGETQRSWKLRSLQVTREGKGTLTFGLRDCESDDIYTFYNNPERGYRVTSSVKCKSTESDVLADTDWSFSNATASLTIVVPFLSDGALPFIVKEVDDTKMTLDIYVTDQAAYRLNLRRADTD